MEAQQQNISKTIQQLGENLQKSIQPIKESLNQNISNLSDSVKTTVNNTLNDFSSSKSVVESNNEFIQSNSIISKLAFIILILIVFVFVFNLGVSILNKLSKPTNSPYIVKGLSPASKGQVVTQNPSIPSSITIQRSNNNKSGAEFTWSVWLYVLGNGNTTTYSHVFNKGDSNWDMTTGLSSVNNAPGFYLINTTSTNPVMGLHIIMDTEDMEGKSQTLDITEIPLQKWFNVCIRLQNVIMDVYVNGTNSGRIILPAVPRQNYNDVNICQNGGFIGDISDLRYFDHALSIFEINNIVYKGPNMNISSSSSLYGSTVSKGMNYISNLWYFGKM